MSFTTPVEIDTQIASLMAERLRPMQERDRQIRYANAENHQRHYFDADALDEAVDKIATLDRAIVLLEERYTGWARYWHVTNANGHVHTSTSCSSCFPDTLFAWRTDLSGLSEAEVVEREAYQACTVCMPIAPAEQKAARERHTREQREAKQAERQTKADEKAAKALDRARKHVIKVEKALCELTGEPEGFEAIQVFARDWSNYGHDGRKNLYEATMDLPTMVGNTLSAIKARQDGERSPIYELSEAVETALTERGLL